MAVSGLMGSVDAVWLNVFVMDFLNGLARVSQGMAELSVLIDKRYYGRRSKSTRLILMRENCVKREPT